MSRLIGLMAVVLSIFMVLSKVNAGDTKKPKVDADSVFKKLDANNDGLLSKMEFLKLADHFKYREKARTKLTAAYDKIDPQNKGLTKDVFRRYLESVRKKDDQP